MPVAMEKFTHTPQNPVTSWDDLKSTECQKILNKAPLLKQYIIVGSTAIISVLTLNSCSEKTEKDRIHSYYKKIESTYSKAQGRSIKESADVEDAINKLNKEKEEANDAKDFERELKILHDQAEIARRNSDKEKMKELRKQIKILKKKYKQ